MQSTRLRCTDRCRYRTLLSIYILISYARSACVSDCICEQQCIFHNAPTKCQCSSKHEQYVRKDKYFSAHQYITAHPYWNRPYSTVLIYANHYWNRPCSIPSGADAYQYWNRPYSTAVVVYMHCWPTRPFWLLEL